MSLPADTPANQLDMLTQLLIRTEYETIQNKEVLIEAD